MNTKMQDINHVRILAKIEAQKLRQDQIIINSYEGRNKVFRILPREGWDGTVVETVRYTPEVEHRDVLRDNGNGKSGTVDYSNKQVRSSLENLDMVSKSESNKKSAKKTKSSSTVKTKRKTN